MKTKKPSVQAKARLRSKRPIHKKFLLHPISLAGLLTFGGVLVLSSLNVDAATYNVSATVPAAPLSSPAVITSPEDKTTVDASPVQVSGSCPDQSYVILSVNGNQTGEALCDNNTFTISAGLVTGNNILNAQDYNITDQAGPTSASITLHYQPPASPSASTTPTTQPSPGSSTYSNPPVISAPAAAAKEGRFYLSLSGFHYQVFKAGQSASFGLNINNGQAPYALTVVWGDGKISTLVSGANGLINLTHVYYDGSDDSGYQVTVDATDSSGQTSGLQFDTLVKGISAVALAATTTSLWQRLSYDLRVNSWVIIPIYMLLLVAVVSFWMGERQELRNLVNQKKVTRKVAYRKS